MLTFSLLALVACVNVNDDTGDSSAQLRRPAATDTSVAHAATVVCVDGNVVHVPLGGSADVPPVVMRATIPVYGGSPTTRLASENEVIVAYDSDEWVGVVQCAGLDGAVTRLIWFL